MKKLTAEDLRNLKFEDIVYRFENGQFRRLFFVSQMPRSENYLIFCDGEYLTHLYIDTKGEFRGDWYQGNYDSKFVGNLKLKLLESEIESVNKIYFKNN